MPWLSNAWRSWCVLSATFALATTAGAAQYDPGEDAPFAALLLIEAETGAVLFETSADVQRSPASTLKLLLQLVVMDAVAEGRHSLGDSVYTSAWASHMGGSQVFLHTVGEPVRSHAGIERFQILHLCLAGEFRQIRRGQRIQIVEYGIVERPESALIGGTFRGLGQFPRAGMDAIQWQVAIGQMHASRILLQHLLHHGPRPVAERALEIRELDDPYQRCFITLHRGPIDVSQLDQINLGWFQEGFDVTLRERRLVLQFVDIGELTDFQIIPDAILEFFQGSLPAEVGRFVEITNVILTDGDLGHGKLAGMFFAEQRQTFFP